MSQSSSLHTSTSNAPALREFTLRAVILGGLITLVFTAANVYLGLKVGLTFATSIPAAVISMAILRSFAHHSIVENNIVQTIASAAGTLSAIIFVLPGLIIIGWWQNFDYWETAAVCAIGGILGVMYSIPLRRALVTGSDLPYPEGVAAAEVLKVGDEQGSARENSQGLRVIGIGTLTSALLSLLTAMKVMVGELSTTIRVGSGATMITGSFSLALIGVGHLVGLSVGIAMIIGLIISFGILMPILSSSSEHAQSSGGELSEVLGMVFSQEIRFVGAGAMSVAAVWTLLKIIRPVVSGLSDSLRSSRTRKAGHQVSLTEQDIPFHILVTTILGIMVPIGILLWLFLDGTSISHHTTLLILISIVFTLTLGLIIASICGYMAGLIGASNSPISGVGILIVLSSALLIKVTVDSQGSQTDTLPLVAYTLFVASIVFGISTISNDNLQDLKTGQLVGATPWKQQLALIIGVIFGSLIIPPVLNLMLHGFGFAGMDGAGPDALAAPQATLLSSIAQGIFGGSLDWHLLKLGALIGVGIIILNEILSSRTRYSIPPLAVGMGMYLPMAVTIIIPLGAILGYFYNKWSDKRHNSGYHRRLGTLLATGLIVGESLFGVVHAGIIAFSGTSAPLAIVPEGWENIGQFIGILLFFGSLVLCYRWLQSHRTDSSAS